MKNFLIKSSAAVALLLTSIIAVAQESKPVSVYNYNETFGQNFYSKNGTDDRYGRRTIRPS